jgi:hypothetical protein
MLANPQVVVLDIGANNLTDGSLMCVIDIIRNTKIESLQIGRREISLQENRYSKEGLMMICDTIAETNGLRCFGLSGVPLAKQTRTYKAKDFSKHLGALLEHGTRLENLDISWSGLHDCDQSLLARGFRLNDRLKYLNISDNSFPKGLKLVDGICRLDRLRRLDIGGCGLGGSACGVISKRFAQGWGVIRLNMSRNPIGTRGVLRLLLVLCMNDTLVELNLSDTNIDPTIADDLKSFLMATTVLRDIDLSKNNLGDPVASVFADVLPTQDTIVNLWMATCRIGDRGAVALCTSLTRNTTMKRLSLRDNFMTERAGFELSEVLRQNETLKWIDLTSTQIDCFGLAAIDAIMRRNRETARDRHLQDLRKKYVKLIIQKSKIPGLTDQLHSLVEQNDELTAQINNLNERIQMCEAETSGNLRAIQKAIDDLVMMIETEDVQIKLMAETLEKMKEENDTLVAQTKAKTLKERQALANVEAEAAAIERATAEFREEAVRTEEHLRKDILFVEGMLEELQQKLASSEELRNYEIPEYPFPEEIVKVRPILAVESSPGQSARKSARPVASARAVSAARTASAPGFTAARRK